MYLCEEGGGGVARCGGREVREGVLRLETGEQEREGKGVNCV